MSFSDSSKGSEGQHGACPDTHLGRRGSALQLWVLAQALEMFPSRRMEIPALICQLPDVDTHPQSGILCAGLSVGLFCTYGNECSLQTVVPVDMKSGATQFFGCT